VSESVGSAVNVECGVRERQTLKNDCNNDGPLYLLTALSMSRLCFTLDVVTDGSEFTGQGTAFISVWRKPKSVATASEQQVEDNNEAENAILSEVMATTSPLARYAISGLGDATARLCADQRIKLAPTRAVFVPSLENCWDGLPALLFALQTAGAPSLHIVTSDDGDKIEELAGIILGSNRKLKIMTCQVPCHNNPSKSDWWKVYNDDYLTVHASCCDERDPNAITFLYTIHLEENLYTIALIPPQCRDVDATYSSLKLQNLPVLKEQIATTIDCVLALDPVMLPQQEKQTASSEEKRPSFLVTRSKRCQGQDPGILIRAQQVAQDFHDSLPWAFPFAPPKSPSSEDSNSGRGPCPCPFLTLCSCTSVLFHTNSGRMSVLDRRKEIWGRTRNFDWSSTFESLHSLLPKPPTAEDENEIDLDEEGDESEQEKEPESSLGNIQEPHLVVLGTGCASPSALRGASGYALIFPNHQRANEPYVLLLDCGEGVASMFSRYAPNIDWASCIAGIWISHAHLDHYGGLPTLLRVIAASRSQRQRQGQDFQPPLPKEQRREAVAAPWVMAPAKVLRFLDLLLHCQQGRHRETNQHLFFPLTHHRDTNIPRGPWTWFQNIQVHHSCSASYGLLLGWKSKSPLQQTYYFCLSGDTRPCRNLVQACRHALSRESSSSAACLFLLHEATFQEQEQEYAESKKHSTIPEAIQVARDIPATKVLLSHFSQRYVSLSTTAVTTTTTTTTTDAHSSSSNPSCAQPPNDLLFPVGLAMDGLWIPLTTD
jgi:ribonuclease BN (tRNA processing enzyme)